MRTTTYLRQLRDLTAAYLLDIVDPEAAPTTEDEPLDLHIYQDVHGDLLFLKNEEEVRLAYEADLAFVEETMEEHGEEVPDDLYEIAGRRRPVFVFGLPAIRHIIAIAQNHGRDQDLALMEVMANVDWSDVDLLDPEDQDQDHG